jgi:hypothetical protein
MTMNDTAHAAGDYRPVLLRDFLIFQLKLVIDGLKDVVLFQVSIVAAVVDLLLGRRRRPVAFYSVLRLSERFDLWLNLNAAASGAAGNEDGLFGASRAGSANLVGHLEQMFRGGDTPRRGSSGKGPDHEP